MGIGRNSLKYTLLPGTIGFASMMPLCPAGRHSSSDMLGPASLL